MTQSGSKVKIFKNAENIYSKNNQLDNEKIDTILTFFEMLKYKHFIVGNSSFAFWAAYLKSDINSYVTVPDPWFKNHNHRFTKNKLAYN